jgi:hypothetical protein
MTAEVIGVDSIKLWLWPCPVSPGSTSGDPAVAQHLSGPDSSRDGGDAVVRGETGDQTDQESRSTGQQAAARVTAMDITIHVSFLPHNDPDASLAFYRDTLGFEARKR